MRLFQQIVIGFLFFSATGRLIAADRGTMVEITLGGQQRTGTVILHDATTGWFLERDGRLDQITLGDVTRFRQLGRFQPYRVIELRERLGREFGNGYSIGSSSHYLVVAPTGTADRFSRLFEDLYRQLVVVFTARGFRIREPEFPLVAVVLPDQGSFLQYCQKEQVQPRPGLRGYYLPSSNRVALFDATRNGLTDVEGLDETVIHEATHQIAFNLGIHSRVAPDPKWIIEGLATVFEREGARLSDRRGSILTRVNPERYQRFQEMRQRKLAPGSLTRLVESDDLFDAATLDAYAQAWALTFYLLERRPTEYGNYLQKLSRRDPWAEYTPEARQADFQASFGRDLSQLQIDWERYFASLAASGGN